MMMPDLEAQPQGGTKQSQKVMLLIMRACRSQCECEVCVLARSLADDLEEALNVKGGGKVARKGKARGPDSTRTGDN